MSPSLAPSIGEVPLGASSIDLVVGLNPVELLILRGVPEKHRFLGEGGAMERYGAVMRDRSQ